MYLAVVLHQPNVDRMLGGMTVRQFYEWEQYFNMNPFGERREDYRAARLLQQSFNLAVKKEYVKPDLEDFMLKFVEPDKPAVKTRQSVGDQMAVFAALVQIYNSPNVRDNA